MNASSLARLPAELRCQIYELVLLQEQHVIISLHHERPPTSCEATARMFNAFDIRTSRRYPLVLAQTCRQLRREAMDTFFAVNTFRIPVRLTGLVGFPTDHSVRERADQALLSTCARERQEENT